jgi:hypothetical protein
MVNTVRVDADVHAALVELASEEHRPIGRVIEDAVNRYRKEKFWKEVNESVERLRADPVAWKDYQDEIAFFQGGSMDGLEDEEPYFTAEELEEILADHARAQGG